MRKRPRWLVRGVSAPGQYARRTLDNGEWIEHFGGADWCQAARPRRLHRCWPQTRAWLYGELVERCACGSIRLDGEGPWMNRNSRSKEREHEDPGKPQRH